MRRRWRRGTVLSRLLLATGLVGALATGASVLLIGVVEQQRETADRRRDANRVSAVATAVEKTVIDLELGTRGYLLTGEERFLEPWRRSIEVLPKVTADLRVATGADPRTAPYGIRIERAGRWLIQDHALPLVERARSRPGRMPSVAAVSEGKRRVDAIRALNAEFSTVQRRVAASATAEAEQAARSALLAAVGALVGSLLLPLGLALVLARGISRPIARTASAADRLRAGDLEARLPLAGPSELVQMADSFNAMANALKSNRERLESQNEALASSREEAERANLAKTRFLSRMNHELRTPLNAILGYTDLMAMDERSADDEHAIRQVQQAGRHLLGVIDELIDISRIEAGEMALAIEAVDPTVATSEAAALVTPLAREHEVTVDVRAAGACGPVAADPQRLRQVLVNLASNAVKYNRPGGSVTVTAEPAGERTIRFEVRDTGQGMSEEAMERLFTPFDRLGAERTNVAGTGLGMVITQRMVEAMGGQLEVSSRLGAGTTCAFTLKEAT